MGRKTTLTDADKRIIRDQYPEMGCKVIPLLSLPLNDAQLWNQAHQLGVRMTPAAVAESRRQAGLKRSGRRSGPREFPTARPQPACDPRNVRHGCAVALAECLADARKAWADFERFAAKVCRLTDEILDGEKEMVTADERR